VVDYGGHKLSVIGITINWPKDGPLSGMTEKEKEFVNTVLQYSLHEAAEIIIEERERKGKEDGMERKDEGLGTG